MATLNSFEKSYISLGLCEELTVWEIILLQFIWLTFTNQIYLQKRLNQSSKIKKWKERHKAFL